MEYTIGVVSPVAMTGMVFSLIIAIGVPVALCIAAKRRLGAKMSALVTGAAVFAVFALGLESLMHQLVLGSAFGTMITENVWLYAAYGGLAAAVFEEFGRLVAMKWCMKRTLSRENAIMYGIGHGGIEAVLIVGLAYISNIATAIMINSGALASQLAAPDAATAEATVKQLAALWETAPGDFFLAGVERLSALTLHICLSYFVYRAVRYGEGRYFVLALVLHFAVDAGTVIITKYLSVYALEAALAVAMAALAVWVVRLYRAEGADKPPVDTYAE